MAVIIQIYLNLMLQISLLEEPMGSKFKPITLMVKVAYHLMLFIKPALLLVA